MNALAVCAGVGGLELGLRLACPSLRVVGYVERDPFAASVLVARMGEAALDEAPVADALQSFDGRRWRGSVDCVLAGFPCQPVSLAGPQLAEEDARWLWPDLARLVRQVGPGTVYLENVPGLLVGGGLGAILGSLADLRYVCAWCVRSAAGVGAPHERRRVFILAAHPHGSGVWQQPERDQQNPAEHWHAVAGDDGEDGAVADSLGTRLEGQERSRLSREAPGPEVAAARRSWWSAEPDVGRMADGVPARVDRLRTLGNACVPAVAASAFEFLSRKLMPLLNDEGPSS